MTIKKVLFILTILMLNTIALFLIGLSFLGASNTNGEGAPVESELTYFVKRLLYVLMVSCFFSLAAFLTTLVFKRFLPRQNLFIKRIFLVELTFLVGIYLLTYFVMTYRFT